MKRGKRRADGGTDRKRGRRPTTLRARILVWFSAFLVLFSALTALSLVLAAQYGTKQTAMTSLTRELEFAERAIYLEDGQIRVADRLSASRNGVTVALFDASDGRPLFGRIPASDAVDEPFADGALRTIGSNVDGAHWYLLDRRVVLPDGMAVWVRGMTLSAGSGALDGMSKWSLVALPFVLLLALLGGWLLIRRSTRPMERIAKAVEQVDGADGLRLRLRPKLEKYPTREVEVLADAFDQMLERLQETFERETRFTADASHELRTPVAVALAACEDALACEDPDERREAISDVHRQLERMTALLSRLLALSRADRGVTRLQMERVDLSALVLTVAEEISDRAQARDIRVETAVEPGVTVEGDEALLLQMLLNLAENGCKYGKIGGFLRLTLRADGGKAVGTVEDDGIGISAEHLPHVWERFYRVDASRARTETASRTPEDAPSEGPSGFGLGLSTVQFILQAHGGDISVASELGSGSTFTYTLPRTVAGD